MLATSQRLAESFAVSECETYKQHSLVTFQTTEDFEALLDGPIPDSAHVLVVAPGCYFRSPTPDRLGPRRQLAVMACNSTPTSMTEIEHFLRMGELNDPDAQEALTEQLFERGEKAGSLTFRDSARGTDARFNHLRDDYQWHEQMGRLGWGEQQLFPSGEVSVLPLDVYATGIETALDVTGTLTFLGQPVVHSGTPSFLESDQERIFRALATMRNTPVLAHIEAGVIREVEAGAPESEPAVRMLRDMFEVDSRYRDLIEIGFSVNTTLQLFESNSAMNEVYGGEHGSMHFGVGLIPHTQYHLDLICPETSVLAEDGSYVFGKPVRRGMRRQKSAMCPCLGYDKGTSPEKPS